MASATKKIKINGALYRLSSGVQVWTRRGKSQLVACVSHSDGRKERQFFEMGAEGVRQANSAVNQAATEVQTYGTAFGALSVPERQAIEVYRAYAAECIAQGVAPMSLLDVLSIGLKKAREVTSCVAYVCRAAARLFRTSEKDFGSEAFCYSQLYIETACPPMGGAARQFFYCG